MGAPEPTGSARESRQAAEEEAAEETEEQAESEAEGSEVFYAEALGDAIWRGRRVRCCNSDAELGAAVRTWLSEREEDFSRPRRHASRYAPY